jgi:hexosaminidase
VEGWDIEDSPRFGWRGLGLDVARHFFPKSFLLKLVDVAAFHKFNVLHLHLTDDQGWRLPVERYPRLTEVGAWRRESPLGHEREHRWDGKPHGGYYSKADLSEVVAYAARRFVTVVPEVDMPGHMQAAIASYPELGNTAEKLEVYTRWGISDHVLNMEEATVRFCADVLEEVMAIFPGPYLHIGGDECPTTEWAASPRAQARCRELGLEGVGQFQAWFTSRMAEVVAGGGRQLVAWDEVLDAGAPPGTLVTFWRYDHDPTVPARAARQGLDVVMAPEPWSYFDWSYSDDPREPLAIRGQMSVEKAYSSEPVAAEVAAAGLAQHIRGVEAELWTEYVATPEHAEYMYFPRACAMAEVGWSQGPKDWAEFEQRLAAHLRRLDALGVNYRPLDGPNPGQARAWAAGGQA